MATLYVKGNDSKGLERDIGIAFPSDVKTAASTIVKIDVLHVLHSQGLNYLVNIIIAVCPSSFHAAFMTFTFFLCCIDLVNSGVFFSVVLCLSHFQQFCLGISILFFANIIYIQLPRHYAIQLWF